MKKFLVLYRSPISSKEQMMTSTPEQAKAAMEAWMAWAGKVGMSLVDVGSPLGDSTILQGLREGPRFGGYSIVQAETLDAAENLFEAHPHLKLPGASIEVVEMLRISGI